MFCLNSRFEYVVLIVTVFVALAANARAEPYCPCDTSPDAPRFLIINGNSCGDCWPADDRVYGDCALDLHSVAVEMGLGLYFPEIVALAGKKWADHATAWEVGSPTFNYYEAGWNALKALEGRTIVKLWLVQSEEDKANLPSDIDWDLQVQGKIGVLISRPNPSREVIEYKQIVMNGIESAFSCIPGDPSIRPPVQSVAHEIGHAIGIAHPRPSSPANNTLMDGQDSGCTGDLWTKSCTSELAQTDADALDCLCGDGKPTVFLGPVRLSSDSEGISIKVPFNEPPRDGTAVHVIRFRPGGESTQIAILGMEVSQSVWTGTDPTGRIGDKYTVELLNAQGDVLSITEARAR